MKKFLLVVSLFILILTLGACNKKDKLYVLSVGDYINMDLVDRFQNENNCKVVYSEVGSNEEIYQKLKNDKYDVVVPSDYMIDRLYQENLVLKLDLTKLPNYEFSDLFTEAQTLMNTECQNFKDYFVPYFWGTVGILYNTDVVGLTEYINENGLKAMFSNNSYKKGMYNSSRDALSMALLYLYGGEEINSTDPVKINAARDLLINNKYTNFGTDDLKSKVYEGMLDMALVYSGDYLDQLYIVTDEEKEVNFNYYVPESTNVWIDGMCITSTSENNDLAYKFIDFFATPEITSENADYIGYAPLSKTAYNSLYNDYGYDYDEAMFFPYPEGKGRFMYHYVSNKHYNELNDRFDEVIAASNK